MRYLWGLFLITFMSVTAAWAEEAGMSIYGPSGLLFTQSTITLDPGKIGVAVNLTNEKSATPDFTINKFIGTITYGLPRGLELSAQLPYFFSSDVAGNNENALSDLNLSVKWRFLEQNKDLDIPAFGLSVTYYLPTAKEGFGIVESWGIKALLISSAEVDMAQPLGSYIVGFYADGGIFVRDISKPEEEKNAMLDLGLLFPLTTSRQLHLLLEGNATVKNDLPFEEDYVAATGGLRYITSTFSLTAAFQHRFKRDAGFDDTNHFIIQTGLLF